MRLGYALLAVALATALGVGGTALAGSGATAARKQRIAIDMVMNENDRLAGDGTFTLSPLTPGPLEGDKGTVTITGFGWGTTLRNGMKVVSGTMGQDLKGRSGRLGLALRLDENEMKNGVRVQVGTWRIAEGTGAYSGFRGNGRYVSVRMPNGRTFVRQEGWVTVSG